MIETAGAAAPHIQAVREHFSGRELARVTPLVNVLSNGRLAVVTASTGASLMLHNGDPITYWDTDETGRGTGYRSFIRDIDSGQIWSLAVDQDDRDDVSVVMDTGITEVTRVSAGIEATTSTIVMSDDDIEVRRIRLRNTSATSRSIELLSIVDLVSGGDEAPPPNVSDAPYRFLLVGREGTRAIGIGSRGPGEARTAAIATADVLDPTPHTFDRLAQGDISIHNTSERTSIATIRRITLDPAAEATVEVFTVVSMEADPVPVLPAGASFDFDGEIRNSAGREAQRMLMHHIRPDHVRYFRRVGGAVAFDLPKFRAPVDLVRQLRVPIEQIEQHGFKMGRPAIVARIADETEMKLVRYLLTAHRYWKDAAIPIDLMFLNDRGEIESAEKLQMLIESEAAEYDASLYERGGVLSEYADDIMAEDQIAIQSYASFLAPGELPMLRDFELEEDAETTVSFAEGMPEGSFERKEFAQNAIENQSIRLASARHGLGAMIHKEHGLLTGSRMSAAPEAEAQMFFLRDETLRTFRTLSPVVSDRLGARGISEPAVQPELTVILHPDLPLQVARLTLRNEHQDARVMSVFMLAELALGADSIPSRRFIHTAWLPRAEALLAYNGAEDAFRTAPVFAAARGETAEISYSTDRTAFIGRGGSVLRPRLLRSGGDLNDSSEAAAASAVILQAKVSLGAGESTFVDFMLGHGESEREVRRILKSLSKPADRESLFQNT